MLTAAGTNAATVSNTA